MVGFACIVVTAPDIPLNETGASSLALILHELATNSAKYGALADGGQVDFIVEPLPDGNLTLTWVEKGAKAQASPSSTPGFGSRVIRMSAQNIRGEVAVEWRPDGLFWQMVAPLKHIIGSPDDR